MGNTSLRSVFEDAWALYPKRPGNSKADAKRAWRARVKAGTEEAVMLEGVRRYAAYVVAASVEPQYIKLAATFFGPGEHYLSDYTTEDPDRKIQVYNENGEFTPEFLRANEAARRAAAIR